MLAGKRLTVAAFVIALLAFALVGCGTTRAANEVDMGVATFEQSSVTIKAGQAVHFVDPTTGGVHIICVGQGVTCAPQDGAPPELSASQGMTFNQGESHDIVFSTAGTYTVVCIIHPGMQVTVTVTS